MPLAWVRPIEAVLRPVLPRLPDLRLLADQPPAQAHQAVPVALRPIVVHSLHHAQVRAPVQVRSHVRPDLTTVVLRTHVRPLLHALRIHVLVVLTSRVHLRVLLHARRLLHVLRTHVQVVPISHGHLPVLLRAHVPARLLVRIRPAVLRTHIPVVQAHVLPRRHAHRRPPRDLPVTILSRARLTTATDQAVPYHAHVQAALLLATAVVLPILHGHHAQ